MPFSRLQSKEVVLVAQRCADGELQTHSTFNSAYSPNIFLRTAIGMKCKATPSSKSLTM